MKSILKSKDSFKTNNTVTFGDDIIHQIPNRLKLLHMGELKKIRINRFRLELSEITEINNYKKVGRFRLELSEITEINNYKKVGRFAIKCY